MEEYNSLGNRNLVERLSQNRIENSRICEGKEWPFSNYPSPERTQGLLISYLRDLTRLSEFIEHAEKCASTLLSCLRSL